MIPIVGAWPEETLTLSRATSPKIKDTADRLLESCWRIGFSSAGRLSKRFVQKAITQWFSPGEQRVLVIAPHPDDEVVGCAGTILRHKAAGDSVCVLYVTDGRRSRAGGLGPQEMAWRRREEVNKVAGILGIDRMVWLGFPEGEWATGDLEKSLRTLVDSWLPHLVYAPSRVDFHPEHHKVAYGLAHWPGLQGCAGPAPVLRVYQVQVPLTPVLANLVVPTGEISTRILAAFTAYTTQWDSIARTLRSRAYGARFYGIPLQAEEFWQMPALQYARLHSAPCEQWSGSAFRSLRFRSAGDPLAYLYGLAERRRLAHMAEANL